MLSNCPAIFPQKPRKKINNEVGIHIKQIKTLACVSRAFFDYICGTVIAENIAMLASLKEHFEATIVRLESQERPLSLASVAVQLWEVEEKTAGMTAKCRRIRKTVERLERIQKSMKRMMGVTVEDSGLSKRGGGRIMGRRGRR